VVLRANWKFGSVKRPLQLAVKVPFVAVAPPPRYVVGIALLTADHITATSSVAPALNDVPGVVIVSQIALGALIKVKLP
jgi:hypothetical protein